MVLLSSPTMSIANSTISSDFSSYGSLRSPSGLSRSPLMNAPVGTLDVFNEDLPDTRKYAYVPSQSPPIPQMLPTKHLRVKIPVILVRDSHGVGLRQTITTR